MVFGLVTMSAMVPTIIGLNQATQNTRDNEEERREGNRRQRCNLVATCAVDEGTAEQRLQVHNAKVYLGPDGKIYITKLPPPQFSPFNGRFFQHPLFAPDNMAGFVTLTGEEPPMLRWVFVDAETHECCWGGRQDSEGHVCGPFDWTRDEGRITLQGWEGWLAVKLREDELQGLEERGLGEESQGIWRLYFDENDDGADLHQGVQALEVCLKREPADS